MRKIKRQFFLPLFSVLLMGSCQQEEISSDSEKILNHQVTQAMLKEFFQNEEKTSELDTVEFRRFCQGTDSSIWFSPETGEYGLVTNTGVYEITRVEAQAWCQKNGV